MWFIVTVFLVFGAGRIEAQSCRSTAAQQCRDRIFQIIQQHTQDFTGNDATTLCPTLRDNMACLLWQSANCQTREQQQRSGEHILAAKNYLDRFCDFDGGWRNSRCYQYDEISHCENVFNQRRGSDACIAYNRFKDCVKEVLQKRCSRSDEQSFPSFLVERARELAWTCAAIPGGSSSSFYDHNRHDPANPAIAGARYNNERTGSNYDPNNPNSRYNSDVSNRYSTGYDRYGDRYGTGDRNRPAGYLPNQYDDEVTPHRAQDNSPNLGPPHPPNYPTSLRPPHSPYDAVNNRNNNYRNDYNSNNNNTPSRYNPNEPYPRNDPYYNRSNGSSIPYSGRNTFDSYNRSNDSTNSYYSNNNNRYTGGSSSSSNNAYNNNRYGNNDPYSSYRYNDTHNNNNNNNSNSNSFSRYGADRFDQRYNSNATYDRYGHNASNFSSFNHNNSYPGSTYDDTLRNRNSYTDRNNPAYSNNARNESYLPPRYGGGGVRAGYGGPGASQPDSDLSSNNNMMTMTANNNNNNIDGTPFPPGPHRITTTSTTDSPQRSPLADSYCLHKAQDQIRECDGNHQRRQYNARRYHADERIKESCCATLDYKSCLRNSLTNHCREFGYNTIDSIIAQKVRDADNDCRQFDAYRCTSGTSGLHATPGAGTLAAALGALLLLAWHQTAGGRFD